MPGIIISKWTIPVEFHHTQIIAFFPKRFFLVTASSSVPSRTHCRPLLGFSRNTHFSSEVTIRFQTFLSSRAIFLSALHSFSLFFCCDGVRMCGSCLGFFLVAPMACKCLATVGWDTPSFAPSARVPRRGVSPHLSPQGSIVEQRWPTRTWLIVEIFVASVESSEPLLHSPKAHRLLTLGFVDLMACEGSRLSEPPIMMDQNTNTNSRHLNIGENGTTSTAQVVSSFLSSLFLSNRLFFGSRTYLCTNLILFFFLSF